MFEFLYDIFMLGFEAAICVIIIPLIFLMFKGD